jgi:hypothetical protein
MRLLNTICCPPEHRSMSTGVSHAFDIDGAVLPVLERRQLQV